MLVLVGSLGELLGGRWGEGIFHRPPTDLQDSTSLLQEVTAGELGTWVGGRMDLLAVCRTYPPCT